MHIALIIRKITVNIKTHGIRRTMRRVLIKIQNLFIYRNVRKKIANAQYTYEDFVLNGVRYFDADYYTVMNPEVANAGIDPLQHFLQIGWKENRNPSERFQIQFYLSEYADACDAGICPLVHYVLVGFKEGRFAAFTDKYGNKADNGTDSIRSKLGVRPHFHTGYTEAVLEQGVLNKKIAVHVHVTSADTAEYVLEKLGGIPIPFTLLVSVPRNQDTAEISACIRLKIPNTIDAVIETVEETARNIEPLIRTFASRILAYDYVCHIHTQKTRWYDTVLQNLLGSENIIKQNLNLLYGDAKIVFSEPDPQSAGTAGGWDTDKECAGDFLRKHGDYDIESFTPIVFPYGGMFWAKTAAIKDFLSLPLCYEDFPAEPVQPDGTIIHAPERLILIYAARYPGKSVCIYSRNNPDGFEYYEDRIDFSQYPKKNENIKILSYYLPQFDTNPINDAWHGKGFTEWTRVTAAQPLFYGHYQQHIPHEDLGYYHLTSADVLEKQAQLMKAAGVYGQIFYHYWFSGQLILEKPVQILLQNKHIQMPFCFCWANENWTKKWDGNNAETILEQKYSRSDALQFIRYLIPFFKDSRYITVEGRPVLYIYRVASVPEFQNDYLSVWNEECKREGIEPPYLVATLIQGVATPLDYGMDAAVERAPYDWNQIQNALITNSVQTFYGSACTVFDYEKIIEYYKDITYPNTFPVFRSAFPVWDNTARYGQNAYIVHNSSPLKFQNWIQNLVEYTSKNAAADKQFIIVNAWNEWAEGAHLEPDQKYGYAYLNSIGRVLHDTGFTDKELAEGTDISIYPRLKLKVVFSEQAKAELCSSQFSSVFLEMLYSSSVRSKCVVYADGESQPAGGTALPVCPRGECCDYELIINNMIGFTSRDIENMLKAVIRNTRAIVFALPFSRLLSKSSTDASDIQQLFSSAKMYITKNNSQAKYLRVSSHSYFFDFEPELFAFIQELQQNQNMEYTLVFDHNLGGGTEAYFDAAILARDGAEQVMRLQYVFTEQYFLLTVYLKHNQKKKSIIIDIAFLKYMQDSIRFNKIIVNSLVLYENLPLIFRFIEDLKTETSEVIFLLHDFYAICPSYNLLDDTGKYCNVRCSSLPEDCESCLLKQRNTDPFFAQLIHTSTVDSSDSWRKHWLRFLQKTADTIIVFSANGKKLLTAAYESLENKITVIPHSVPPLRKVCIPKHESLNIGVIGTIMRHKGSAIVQEMQEIITAQAMKNVTITIIGETCCTGITKTGRYERNALPDLIEKHTIDIVFIPSICPETFSYTASEAVLMGLPVAVFNLGAPAERIAAYEKGLIISEINARTALREIVSFTAALRR